MEFMKLAIKQAKNADGDIPVGAVIMYFIPEAVRVEFELPDSVEPVAILIMGYTDAQPSIDHLKRRSLEEYVSYR